jgi:hypothetical protein
MRLLLPLLLFFVFSCDNDSIKASATGKSLGQKKKHDKTNKKQKGYYRMVDGACMAYNYFDGFSMFEEVCMSYCDDKNEYYDIYRGICADYTTDPSRDLEYTITYKFTNMGNFHKTVELKEYDVVREIDDYGFPHYHILLIQLFYENYPY